MVAKNRPLPVTGEKTFFVDTKLDNRVAIEVLQRKDQYCEPETLGDFCFGPLPGGLSDRPIEVSLGYDKHGRAHVEVTDQLSGTDLSETLGNHSESDLHELKARLSEIALLG
jgi:molecular chaperone DnaK (HSP70)